MEARAAYRHVLRAASIAFQGDVPLLQSARIQARTTFVQHRTLDGPAAAEQITHAEDVARILRQNIVQAQRTDVGGEERWRLNIHEDTERGDNESIREAGKKMMGKEGCGCC